MPAAYIHEQIANIALSDNTKLLSKIDNNIHAFELGAQGPDILFFYGLMKIFNIDRHPNKLGITIHQEREGQFLESLLLYAKENDDASFAWILGFVCHYATDCTIHPFVYATSNNDDGTENTTNHLLLETYFDTWYYRKLGNKGIPRQVQCIKKLSKAQKHDIANALLFASSKTFPEYNLTYSQAYHTIGDMGKITSMLYSPHKFKYYIYSLIEKIIKKPSVVNRHAPAHNLPDNDFLNLNHATWTNPWDSSIVSSKSFPELFDESVVLSAEYMETVIEYCDDKISLSDAMKVLGGRNYSSGLECEK